MQDQRLAVHRTIGCFVRRVGRYSVHAAVICLMAGNRAISGARNRSPAVHREPGPCIARSVHNQPADSRSFPGRRTAYAHRRTPLPGASGPHRWPPEPGSGHRCSRQLNPPPDVRLDIHAATGRVWSANFGELAAVQLHDVGGVAALWLCDADVRAAVQVHDTKAAPGDQLAQVPHPTARSIVMGWRVMIEKKHSRLSHEQLVGVKCRWTRGFLASPDLGMFMGAPPSLMPMRRPVGGLGMHGSDDSQAGPWTLPVIWKRQASGENKCASREIGAANAGMRIKSAAGGNSWIPAIGVSGGVFDAEDSQVQQRKDSCTRSPGTSSHQAQVAEVGSH